MPASCRLRTSVRRKLLLAFTVRLNSLASLKRAAERLLRGTNSRMRALGTHHHPLTLECTVAHRAGPPWQRRNRFTRVNVPAWAAWLVTRTRSHKHTHGYVALLARSHVHMRMRSAQGPTQ